MAANLALSGAMLTLACASSPAAPPQSAPPLHAAGSYQITKTGIEDTCGGPLTPVTVNGSVSHEPGATTIVLSDGYSSFSGTIAADGRFSVPPTGTTPHEGAPIVTTFDEGRFEGGVFDARVTLHVDGTAAPQPFPACRVVQAWRGVRQ